MQKALTGVWARFKAYSRYRTVRSELARLNDKELADIGVNRCDIDKIAKQSMRDYRKTLLA